MADIENGTVYATIDPSGNACESHVPYCGYTYETLQDMAANGFVLQINGKVAKFPTKTELANAQALTQKK